MKKKVIAIVLAIALVAAIAVGLVACNKQQAEEKAAFGGFKPVAKSDLKFGLITLHDSTSTYDKNFIDALNEVKTTLGLSNDQVIVASGIEEGDGCYQKACELAEAGCNIIFADSFGHEDYMIKAAKQYPNVRFAHATGTQAHTELLPNFYNAFASIYEGRYLAGVAAGLKLQAMGKTDAPNIGYVGAYTYAEVISGYTSFYLGVKSVVPSVTMDVQFTGSWFDPTAENAAATNLINNKHCVLISQHADSMGAPNACKEAGVPNVTYNVSTKNECPDSYLIGSRINWAPYYTYLINCTLNGVTAVGFDWVGGFAEESVELLEINDAVAAPGTEEYLETVALELASGARHVFDVNNFKVGGKTLTEYLADVDSDAAFAKDTQVILDGQFVESLYRSAPYFDVQIDGITLLNAVF
jgi:basic membrane protein A